MSEFLPSQLAILILGYCEGRGYTRTVETMLSELPELSEVYQRKKKGQKTNLRLGDLCLTNVIDDYFSSKNIIHESIANYPSTFLSVKKIQALSEQIRSIVEIAIRSKTYKGAQSTSELPNEIAVEEDQDPEFSSESRLDIEATPEINLPGSSMRDSLTQESTNGLSQPESLPNGENLTLDTTPQKRKGSLRKKGQPSPKVQSKTIKQSDADERMEKLIKNLIENKELHTKIADSINNTLFSSSTAVAHKEKNIDYIHSKIQSVDGIPASSSGCEQICSNSNQQQQQYQHQSNCHYNVLPSEVRGNSLQDNIISSLSLQVTNDPMMESILASIGCELDTSSHRPLTTPVPQFSPFHTNTSFSNSAFGIQGDPNSISQPITRPSNFSETGQCFTNNQNSSHGNKICSDILEECFSPSHLNRNQNLTLGECFRNQEINDNIKAPDLTLKESFRRQETDLSNKPQDLTLGECFRRLNEDNPVDKPHSLMLGDCHRRGDESQNEEEAENLSLKKKECENIDKVSHKLPDSSSENSLPATNINSECQSTETLQVESTNSVKKKLDEQKDDSQSTSETNIVLPCGINSDSHTNVEKSVSFNSGISETELPDITCGSEEDSMQKSKDNITDSAQKNEDTCDEPLDLTLLNTDHVDKNEKSLSRLSTHSNSPAAASANNTVDDVGNVSDNMTFVQDLCPKTPQLDYQMPPSLSPMRPPSVRAVPVAMSNDAFIHSKYFSGTPDHPTNYVFTELTPLPPSTPQECEGTSAGTVSREPILNSFITPSSPVVFSTDQKITSVETTLAEENSGSKLIGIRINNDESAVIVEIPSSGCKSLNFESSESVEEFRERSMEPLTHSRKEPKQRHSKRKRKKRDKSTNIEDNFDKEKNMTPDAEVIVGQKRGKKRKNLKSVSNCNNLENEMKNSSKRQRAINRSPKNSSASGQLNDVSRCSRASNDDHSVSENNVVSLNGEGQEKSERIEFLRIPDMSAMEELVDKLETSLVEDITSNNDEIQLQTCNNVLVVLNSDKEVQSQPTNILSLSPQIKSLISFSKSFVLNNNLARSTKSPTSNERIKVYKGSLSTPRNKSNHIRVLDFNTPNKALSSRKKSPRAKANLKFSSPSSKRPIKMFDGLGKRARTQSLSDSPSVNRPLQVILETSREGIDTSTIVANASMESQERKDGKVSEDISRKDIEDDLFLSEDESSFNVETSIKMPLVNKHLTSVKKLKNICSLYTPGKLSPVCLEPTTPYPVFLSSDVQSETNGAELNTPIPVISDTVISTTPCLKNLQESCSGSTEGNYYQPSERSVDSESTCSQQQEDIESILIRTAQLSEIEMANLAHQENNIYEECEDKDAEVSESADNQNDLITDNNPNDTIFRELLKDRPKYKIRNMSNKELGNVVEKERDLFDQMRTLTETRNEKNKENCEEQNERDSVEGKKRERSQKKDKGKENKHDISNLVSFEDFGCNFELLKEYTINILENSHIESSKSILQSVLGLLEKEKYNSSTFGQESKIEFMLQMINYYSLPGAVSDLKKTAKLSLNYDESDTNRLKSRSNSDLSSLEEDNEENNYQEDVVRVKEISEVGELSCVHETYLTEERKESVNKNSASKKIISSLDAINVTECEADVLDEERNESSDDQNSNVSVSLLALNRSDSAHETPLSDLRQTANNSETDNENEIDLKRTLITNFISSNSQRLKGKSAAFTHWGKNMVLKEKLGNKASTHSPRDFCHGEEIASSKDQTTSLDETTNAGTTKDLSVLKVSREESTSENENGDNNNLSFESVENKTPVQEDSLHSNGDNNNDEYSLIERQLAALDGSAINSPCLRTELSSNAMDDANITGMFTPSTHVAEEGMSFINFNSEQSKRLNSNSLIAFTRFPGTPVKQVEEICQTMVKNQMAFVAIPSQSIEYEREQAKARREKEIAYNESDTEHYERQNMFKESPQDIEFSEPCEEYVDNESVMQFESEEEDEPQCTLSYSECFDLLSLNLSRPKSKCKTMENSSKQTSNALKSKASQVKQRNTRQKSNTDNKNSPKGKIGRKGNVKVKDVTNSNKSKTKTSSKNVQESKTVEVDIEQSTCVKSPKSLSRCKTNLPSSSRKLDFANAKKKRKQDDEKAIISKARKLNPSDERQENSSGKNIQKKSSKQNSPNVSSVTLPHKRAATSSLQPTKNENKKKKEEESCNSNIVAAPKVSTSNALDDTISLEELHLSSSESDEEQEQDFNVPSKSSSSPKSITKSLLEGAAFELSETPKKLQTVISKYPNQDSYFHYNEESILSIPPTPGKHLFLPTTSSASNASEKSDKKSNALQSSYASLALGPLYSEGGKCQSPKWISPKKKKSDSTKQIIEERKDVGDKDVNIASTSTLRKPKRSCVQNSSAAAPIPDISSTSSEDLISKLSSIFEKPNECTSGKNISRNSKGISSKRTKSPAKSTSSVCKAGNKKLENTSSPFTKEQAENLKFLINALNKKK